MTIRQNVIRQIFEESVSVKISPVKILRYTVLCYYIAGFFEGENFHQFHESIAIYENISLEMFTKNIISLSALHIS